MKLFLLPFLREGITPTAAAGVRSQVNVGLRLESPGRTPRDISHSMALAGPGDILGIEPRQVLRVSPAAGTRDAEPDFFPLVEFDAPDLPWAYSPTLQTGTRLLPWITLIVLEADDSLRVDRGAQGQSPWMLRLSAERARELPDLADAWSWAHAQVACDSVAQMASTLATQPDRTLSRLLAPRRLRPDRSYVAAVVPTFLSGRLAGLGENPVGHPSLVTGLEPAWSATAPPDRLPAYHVWTFRTGAAGDFETLAKRIRAARLDPNGDATTLHLSLPNGDVSQTVEWEAPLRVPGRSPKKPRRPAAAVTEIRKVLKMSANPPVLGPSYFGLPWTTDRVLVPLTSWAPELNLTPALRAAAGLGADAVRAEQDALVAAATEQLDAFKREQREGRRRQLATAVVNRVAFRLAQAPSHERARVNAPLAARVQQGAADVGLYTIAGRRIARKAGRLAAFQGTHPVVPATELFPAVPAHAPTPGGGAAVPTSELEPVTLADSLPPITLPPLVARVPLTPAPPAPQSDATGVKTGVFAPRFSRPMSEPLAERFPELMLPGLGSLPAEGAVLADINPAFIEAFMVGANQELNYELLWRGLSADRQATAFRRFWPHAADTDDIGELRTWAPDSTIGSHVTTGAGMVLLVRGELVRRYPGMLIAAVPAVWNANESRSPGPPTGTTLPTFRGPIGEDVIYAGFAQLTPKEAVGTAKKNDAKPGWFMLLAENPGDPRFGLDSEGGTTPPTRATLSWEQLSLPADALHARLSAFPVVPDANFNPSTATSATVASLVRQRPFRAFLHASLLVPVQSA